MKTSILFFTVCMGLGSVASAQMSNQLTDDGMAREAKYTESREKSESQKNVVKLYSRKEKSAVIITSHRPQDVQLYIFDLEGTILHKTVLKKNEKTKIDGLAKGTYTYTIFDNDESVEEGKLVIK